MSIRSRRLNKRLFNESQEKVQSKLGDITSKLIPENKWNIEEARTEYLMGNLRAGRMSGINSLTKSITPVTPKLPEGLLLEMPINNYNSEVEKARLAVWNAHNNYENDVAKTLNNFDNTTTTKLFESNTPKLNFPEFQTDSSLYSILNNQSEYFDAPNYSTSPLNTLDLNKERETLYNARWKSYLDELSKNKRRINLKKARSEFDTMFNNDWNEISSKKYSDFARQTLAPNSEVEKARKAVWDAHNNYGLDVEDSTIPFDDITYDWGSGVNNTWRTQNENVLNLLSQEELYRISGGDGTISAEDAAKWQLEIGAGNDLKFGSGTIAALKNRYNYVKSNFGNDWVNPALRMPKNNPVISNSLNTNYENIFKGTERIDANGNLVSVNPEVLESQPLETVLNNNNLYNTIPFNGEDSYWFEHSLIDDIRHLFLKNTGKLLSPGSFANLELWNTPEFLNYKKLVLDLYNDSHNINFMYRPFHRYIKKHLKGGNINKFQQGGTMNNQEELQKAFMAFLIEDAQAQGVQILSEQDLQAYAEQLGEEGLKAKYQEFMQKMQGQTQMARLGAKLNYIKTLKGDCPEGQELVYFKKGGRVCKACQGKMLEEGDKIIKKKNAVEEFKEKRKMACGSKMKRR